MKNDSRAGRSRHALLVLVISFAALACGETVPKLGGAHTGSMFDDPNVAEWRLADAPRVTIGERGLPALQRVTDALLLGDTIVIANDGFHQVLFVSSDGRALAAQGREGDGPGEYRLLSDLARLGNDTIAVWDQIASRISLIGRDGRLINVLSVDRPDRPGIVRRLVGAIGSTYLLFGDRIDLAQAGVRSTGFVEHRDSVVYRLFDLEGGRVAKAWAVPGREVLYGNAGQVNGDEPVLFGRNAFAATRNNDFVIAANDSLALTVIRPELGRSLIVRFPFTAVSVPDAWTRSERERLLAKVRAYAASDRGQVTVSGGRFGAGASAVAVIAKFRTELIEQLPARETLPAFSDLRGGARGDLWIRAYTRPADSVVAWVVIDPQGTLLGRVLVPRDLEILAMSPEALLVHGRGALDEELLEIWTIRGP